MLVYAFFALLGVAFFADFLAALLGVAFLAGVFLADAGLGVFLVADFFTCC